MCACQRPTEAACFRVQKGANNHLLIVAGVERFLRHAYAARFCVIQTRKTLHVLRVYTQTLIGVFFVHRNGNTHLRMRVLYDDEICFTSMDSSFKRS